jgi:D-sedoheptulose 7-phosphate isomerase
MFNFIKSYNKEIQSLTNDFTSKNFTDIKNLIKNILICQKNNSKVILVGNGGSAATCSHVSVDLTKNAKVRSVNFNESDLITCFANDFGYENWIKEALKMYCEKDDLVILLSASGKSKNILYAAQWLKKSKIKFATFSGMKENNSLNKINSNGINFWVNSMSYNKVEIIHHYILLLVIDLIIDKS